MDYRYPDEVAITDIIEDASSDTNTPAGEPSDDFFSSWDKPTIKRPSNPPSRTGTPASLNRTASPFLNPGQNGNGARPKSPLNATSESSAPRPTTTSSAIRKSAAASTARKPNILGAKKNKLGAKKVTADMDLDFDAAEKKAREEAERIEKLGYNPDDADEVAAAAKAAAAATAATEVGKIVSPVPVSARRSGDGAARGMERSSAEMERLGMGIGKLGFGQTASVKKAAAPKQTMGFGSTSRATEESKQHQFPRLPPI